MYAEGEYLAAEAGKSLAAAEIEQRGEHMPENAGRTGSLTGAIAFREQPAACYDGHGRLADIKRHYERSGFFALEQNGV